MIITELSGGRGWADAPAAASIHRIDRQLGRLADINEAGRSAAQANANAAAWAAYLNGTGPKAPYALDAEHSVHCTGNAADSDDWYDPSAAAVWRDNGWRQTARYNDDRDEPWHGEYFPELDNHINDPAPADVTKEDIMAGPVYINETEGTLRRAVLDVTAGVFTPRTTEEAQVASALFNGKDVGTRQFDVAVNLTAGLHDKFIADVAGALGKA